MRHFEQLDLGQLDDSQGDKVVAKKTSKPASKNSATARRLKSSKKKPGEKQKQAASLPKDACKLAAMLDAFKSDPSAQEHSDSIFTYARVGSLLKTWDPSIWNVLADQAEHISQLAAILEVEAAELLDPYARCSFETAMQRRAFVCQDLLPVASPAMLRLLTKAMSVMFDVRNLSPELADKLAIGYGGNIVLEDVEISEAVAASLANARGGVSFAGLRRLPETPGHIALLNRALAQRSGQGLALPALTDAPDRAFELFRDWNGSLLLGVTQLSDDAARHLATISGELDLSRLESISIGVAKALAIHDGDLCLGGLKQLPQDVGRLLASHRGRLDLSGLEDIDNEAAEALARHEGFVVLSGLRRLHSVPLAHKLAQGKLLGFRLLTDISDDVMAAFFDSEGASVSLPKLTHLTDAAAAALAKGKCSGVTLEGLETLSDAAARSLAGYTGYLTVQGPASKIVSKYRK